MPKVKSAPDVSVTKELQAAIKALQPAVARLTKLLCKFNPASLPVGALADMLYELRATDKALDGLAKPLTEDVLNPIAKAIEEHFVQTLAVGESSGVQGMMSRVQITDSPMPTLENPEKFYAYIRKTNAFELLNRNLNRAAIQERWEAKKQVPGVGVFHVKKVSCTKLGGGKRGA